MNLRAVFLARRAVANADGTFDVEGGGVTEFRLANGLLLGAPIRLQFGVVLRLEVNEDEVDQLRPVDLSVTFEGRQLGPATSIPLMARHVPGETRYYHNVIMNMVVDVPGPGAGYLRFSWDGGLTTVPPVHFTVGSPPAG
jgi:hypothetical protein